MFAVKVYRIVVLIVVGVPLFAALFLQSAHAQSLPEGDLTVRLEQFGQANFGTGSPASVPLDMVPLGDGTGRSAVTMLNGDVRLLSSTGDILDNGTYIAKNSFASTGLAVHPDFANNGRIYQVVIASSAGGTSDFGFGSANHNVVLEWTADDPSSDNPIFTSRDILRLQQPSGAHNMTDLAFGPDGLLYIPAGDGAGPGAPPRAQDLTDIYGNIIRIDPVNTSGPGLITSANGQYGIPTSNLGSDGDVTSGTLDEIYAFGLRSPFRLNFDSANGNLYLGDVGLSKREEINLIVPGGNYGWGRFEGTLLHDAGLALASENPVHNPPAFEFGRDNGLIPGDGESVIGGFVYRGSELPDLVGKYVFGDLGRQRVGSQDGSPTYLFYGDVDVDGDIIDSTVRRLRIDLSGEQLVSHDPAVITNPAAMSNGRSETFLLSIGEDINRELYLLVADDPENPSAALNPDGRILRLLTATPNADFDQDLDVDGQDFLTWQRGFGLTTGAGLSNGDASSNGMVDEADLSIWQDQYGSISTVSVAVPEPTSLLLLVLGVLSFVQSSFSVRRKSV